MAVVTYATGYIADPADHRTTPIAHHFDKIGAPAATPDTVDFRTYDVVDDQSISEGCTGFSSTGAIETLFARLGNPLPRLSAYAPWTFARCIDAPGKPLLNEGTEPNQVFRAIAEWGIATLDAWPCDPGIMNDPPTLGRLEGSLLFRFDGAYSIDGNSEAESVDLIRRALAAYVPVTVALIADEAFENYRGGLYVPGGAARGGHMVRLSGYRTNADGSTVFFLCNSWGALWGQGGFAEMPGALASTWRDMRGLAVRRLP